MNKFLLFITIWCCVFRLFPSKFTVNMLIQDYPEAVIGNKPMAINPLDIEKKLIKSYVYQPVSYGIYGLYNGYLSSTNEYGLLSFPRASGQEDFNLIVTEYVSPVLLKAHTIDYWQLDDPLNTAFYLIKRHKDPKTKIVYWKTQEANVPENLKSPLHTIIILAKPSDVYVPLGITPTNTLPDLVLPAIYAKRQLDRLSQAAFILNIKQFFAPLNRLLQQNQATVATIMQR